jgi:general secretion pathway protein C
VEPNPDLPATPPAPIDPNAPPPACEGSMRLVGAIVNTRTPESSFAAITNAAGKVLLYRQGMDIDGRSVVRINSSSVYLQPTGAGVCQLAMFAPPPPAGGASPPIAAAGPAEPITTPGDTAAAGTGGIPPSELEAGITAVSEREYNIQRSLVDRLLENQAELMRTARIIPHEEGGRTVGVKLYGIRRNSLLGRLGMQNGDLLRTINGYDMSSPDSALEAYSRLRGADHLTLSVVRRGNAMTLDYNIR